MLTTGDIITTEHGYGAIVFRSGGVFRVSLLVHSDYYPYSLPYGEFGAISEDNNYIFAMSTARPYPLNVRGKTTNAKVTTLYRVGTPTIEQRAAAIEAEIDYHMRAVRSENGVARHYYA